MVIGGLKISSITYIKNKATFSVAKNVVKNVPFYSDKG